MSELDLLCECITTEGEAEGGGVKFIYMDEGTIYRFENNRMKKIGKQLINKAKREITKRQKIPQLQQAQQQQQDDNEDDEIERKPTKAKRSKKQTKPVVTYDSEEDEDEDDEPEPIPQPKTTKAKRGKQLRRTLAQENLISPSIDLDEYYSNKHKMEYMTNEINRLNGKIGKLKQYKSIVNKLTGGEIDDLPNSGMSQQMQMQNTQMNQQMSKNNEHPGVNDSLFMY